MGSLLTDPDAWAGLASLAALEIVLGIDNVVFISILVMASTPAQARRARRIGLSLAFVFRLAMLFVLTWCMKLTYSFASIFGLRFSWRDIILIGGGLFLIAKSTHEIHREVEPSDRPQGARSTFRVHSFATVVAQLVIIDLVFSIDSIVTAIGMVDRIEIMIVAVMIAMIVMYAASGPVTEFIADHPTTKMLALAFLMLVGLALLADGFHFHLPRGYIYFAMAFAAAVEACNVLARRGRRHSAR
jgi:predicted tellurium resistance membrane protein TerC